MKRSRRIIIAALCIAAVSCTKELRIFSPAGHRDKPSDKVTMSVDPVVFEDSGTRTQASVDELSGLSFTWSAKDTVGVYSPEGGFSRFTLSGEGNTGHAWFTGQGFSLEQGKTYSALYPYDGGKSDPSEVHISYLGRKVSGSDRIGDVIPFDPLYASAQAGELGGADFQFRHLSAFARLTTTIPEADTYSYLELVPTYDMIQDEGDLDISSGIWTPGAGRNVTTVPMEGIKTSANGEEARIWLPFAPQDFRGNDIAALMRDSKGKIYSSRLEGKNFESGKAYRWNAPMVAYSAGGQSSISVKEISENTLDLEITGQFSAITRVSGNRYAIVHDNYKGGGIVYLDLTLNNYGYLSSATCEIPEGTKTATNNREPEGIAYVPSQTGGTLFVAAEGDQKILEYSLEGYPTGRELKIPEDMQRSSSVGNAGFESLAYNDNTGLFWTTTENTIKRDSGFTSDGSMLVRLQSFRNSDLCPGKRYLYLTDKAQTDKSTANIYAFGISDILAMDDGKLLIMEREAHIPNGSVIEMGLGTVVYVKLYEVDPENDKGGILSKRLVKSFKYDTAFAFSNYEGIGFGPVIGGKQTVLMICDSQDHYGNSLFHLPDKIKVLTIN